MSKVLPSHVLATMGAVAHDGQVSVADGAVVSATPRSAPTQPVVVRVGTVTQLGAQGRLAVLLQGDARESEAMQAASCLLSAAQGDLVSCLCLGERVWIQHILVKAEGPVSPPMVLSQGELTIHADALRVSARTSLAISADRIFHQSRMTKESTDEKFSDVTGNRIEYSKNLIVRASQHANIKADSITQVAVSLLKMDGSQVHMG